MNKGGNAKLFRPFVFAYNAQIQRGFLCAKPKNRLTSQRYEKNKDEEERVIMAEVESFTLDHNKVIAPYVRVIATEEGPKGDIITNYDLRFAQPNKAEIPTGAIHTLEHVLAASLRDRLSGIIDVSPFGCRTGFHLIVWGEISATEVAVALKETLREIVEDIEWSDVQGTDAKSCGNYKDHSLFSAKEWAKLVLEQGISDLPFERHTV